MPHFKLAGKNEVKRYLTAHEMIEVFRNINDWEQVATVILQAGKFYPKRNARGPQAINLPLKYCYVRQMRIELCHLDSVLASVDVPFEK